jgi:hypothetical protein
MKQFQVWDNKTKKRADMRKIALKEDWAKGLMFCYMEQFASGEDGTLYLLDECGNQVIAPDDRFTLVWIEDVR